MPERVDVSSLDGVAETMLWPLYNRAVDARRADALLRDPHAIRIADAIDYDYARSFGKPDFGHVIRALILDRALRDWLQRHPDGMVIALGEGLETQFERVDNGRMSWMSVDLPAAIQVRRRFMPDTERHKNVAGSALDFTWMDAAATREHVFVTAAGLLMYLQLEDVRELIGAIFERFGGRVEMAFDIIPRFIIRKSVKGLRKTPHYTTPPMPWGLNRNELQTIKRWHPAIGEVRELGFSGGRGLFYRVIVPLLRRTPGLKNHMPALVHLKS